MSMEKKNGSKKQVLFLVILVLFIGLFVAGYVVKGRPGGIKKIIMSGDLAPEFTIQGADGKYVNLSDLRGNVVMVHFWATWCPPCVDEMPTLDRLHRTFSAKDLKILAVSVDEGGAGQVVPFMRKNNLNVPVFYDPDQSIARLYGTFKFPETYIIDRQGMVKRKVIGSRDWSDPETAKILQDILAAR